MLCPKCGKQLQSDMKFCPFCAVKLDNAENTVQRADETSYTQPKQGGGNAKNVIAVVLVVIAVCACWFSVLEQGSSRSFTESIAFYLDMYGQSFGECETAIAKDIGKRDSFYKDTEGMMAVLYDFGREKGLVAEVFLTAEDGRITASSIRVNCNKSDIEKYKDKLYSYLSEKYGEAVLKYSFDENNVFSVWKTDDKCVICGVIDGELGVACGDEELYERVVAMAG